MTRESDVQIPAVRCCLFVRTQTALFANVTRTTSSLIDAHSAVPNQDVNVTVPGTATRRE